MKKILLFAASLLISQNVFANFWNDGMLESVTVADDGFAYLWVDAARPSGIGCNWINDGSTYKAIYAIDLSNPEGHAMYGIAMNAFKKTDTTVYVRTNGTCVGEHQGNEVIFLQMY